MHSAAEKFRERYEENKKSRVRSGKMTYEEMLVEDTPSIEAKLSYFSFLDDLNRFGRAFQKEYSVELPDFPRIYFYRNKVIEHWDDYSRFATAGGTSGLIGRIMIPFHQRDMGRTAVEENSYNNLAIAFEESGVAIPSYHPVLAGKEYSDMVFDCLQRVDPRLRTFRKDHKTGKTKGIPEPIIDALFQYSFPTPIDDVEQYITRLVQWVETTSGLVEVISPPISIYTDCE